jgi:hypothetical protein
MKKKKFIIVSTEGEGMKIHLNEEGRKGWHYMKMEPFYQVKQSTASHGMGKFTVCLEKDPAKVSFYRVKFLSGNNPNYSNFKVGQINEFNEVMEKCGFEFVDFHHVVVFHLNSGYNTRNSMKGYMSVWEIDMERERAEKMFERMQKVINKVSGEFDTAKMRGAPRPKIYREIKDKAAEYRKKQEEYKKQDAELGFQLSHMKERDEDEILRKADAYEYYLKFIKRVIELDNNELKKQMGKHWDKGLLDVKPDIEEVIESMSLSLDLETMVEEIFWSCEGNIRVSSLPKQL